jgi:hypothetical protein
LGGMAVAGEAEAKSGDFVTLCREFLVEVARENSEVA